MHEFAVKEYEEYQARADRLKTSREDAMEQLEMLEAKYEEMKHRLKDMHMRRMELMGRENIAKANQQMNRVIDDVSDKPFAKFAELEQYIENLEHQVSNAFYKSSFDSKIAKLEKEMAAKEQNNSL